MFVIPKFYIESWAYFQQKWAKRAFLKDFEGLLLGCKFNCNCTKKSYKEYSKHIFLCYLCYYSFGGHVLRSILDKRKLVIVSRNSEVSKESCLQYF